jgi:hypothetical protein
MSDDYPHQAKVTCTYCSSSPSYRRHGDCCLSREAMRMAERETAVRASPMVTGQWEALVDL